jgi:hypothetical protein
MNAEDEKMVFFRLVRSIMVENRSSMLPTVNRFDRSTSEKILMEAGLGLFSSRVRSWNGKIVHLERKEDGLLLTVDFNQKASTTCYEELFVYEQAR